MKKLEKINQKMFAPLSAKHLATVDGGGKFTAKGTYGGGGADGEVDVEITF
jgi:hypothetical protein